MSIWSRANDDVKLAITTWRMAADDHQEHIHDTRPATREEIIADLRRGFDTAAMIVRDIYDGRSNRRSDPIRYAIDLTKEADRRSMLAAQIVELNRLMRDLGTGADRRVMS